jgi:heparan-alpha-glucosaminide N-acetyltransferase
MGWTGQGWCVLMYSSSILALGSFSLRGAAGPGTFWKTGRALRFLGLAALVWLAFAFRGPQGQRIVTLSPFSLQTEWYGILGLIGWAYLVTCLVYLVFRGRQTALLGCMALLLCLFAANRAGQFDGFWLGRIVGIGETLGSLPSISVGGLLLTSFILSTDPKALDARSRFTFCFVGGCAAAAWLLTGAYGISKNSATPAWCLWSCAITPTLWYGFYLVCEVHPMRGIARPLGLAGNNVLLAYLLSEMMPGLLAVSHLDSAYQGFASNLAGAIARSSLCAVVILLLSTRINRLGFRLRF